MSWNCAYCNPPRRKQFWVSSRLNKLRRLAADGLTRAELALAFKVSYNRVTQACEYYKISVRSAPNHVPTARVIDCARTNTPKYSALDESAKVAALYAPKAPVPERYRKYLVNGPAL